jgi:hypothetical protein
MEYIEYTRIYQIAVEQGIRHEADKATEEEWMILSTITKKQIIKQIRQELVGR